MSETVAVLVKAFKVLEAMAQIGAPAPLAKIAQASALPKSTLSRLLSTMMDLGYVGQEPTGGPYFLTSQISYLGRGVRQDEVKLLAMPLMQQLHERFNETINLGVLDGPFVYYVTVLEARRSPNWRVPAGTRDMFYSTALGRAIAAHLDDAEAAALVQHAIIRPRTPQTVSSQKKLLAILAEVRRTGIAVDREENDDGVICFGVPLFMAHRPAAAISVSLPANRYTEALGAQISGALLRLNRQLAA